MAIRIGALPTALAFFFLFGRGGWAMSNGEAAVSNPASSKPFVVVSRFVNRGEAPALSRLGESLTVLLRVALQASGEVDVAQGDASDLSGATGDHPSRGREKDLVIRGSFREDRGRVRLEIEIDNRKPGHGKPPTVLSRVLSEQNLLSELEVFVREVRAELRAAYVGKKARRIAIGCFRVNSGPTDRMLSVADELAQL